MGALRSRRFLRCFYCGKRSNFQYQSQELFHCPSCDATNWLDENGEITDPPAAAESLDRSNLRYATPRLSAPPRSPSPLGSAADDIPEDTIFCTNCLRNQQMLSSTLAQFEWPDNPGSAEYIARERKYWVLRKELEKRYPQVCNECLPKVNRKLHQASYTAQTDHLRRMMDRTRSRRIEVKTRGPLDFIDLLGKLGWHAGFALQAAWHVVTVCLLLTELLSSAQDGPGISVVLGALHRMSTLAVPYSDRLMQWAINLGMCSFPWNPHFRQSIRGFTTHILGFRQWYTYQLLSLLVRFVAVSIAQYSKSRELPVTTQLSAQIIIPMLMAYIYLTAKKSIHTDTTPLFRRPAELTTGLHPDPSDRSASRDPNALGDILDDILRAPAGKQNQVAPSPPQQSASFTFASDPQTHIRGISRGSSFPAPQISNKSVSFSQEEASVKHYDDEMDWSPSASQHRAFSSYNPYRVKNTNPRFSDAPTEPKPGPIWYKVPPAPSNPAQRVRNPPMRPIIRESPKEKKELLFQSTGRHPLGFGSGTREDSDDLSFAPPKFFAPEPEDDPRDSLSKMFAKSFTISPSPEERDERYMTGMTASEFQVPDAIPNRTITRLAELITLFAAVGGWVFALRSEEHYARNLALASVCVYLIVSIRLAADLEVDHQIRGNARPSFFLPSFAKLAVLQAFLVILLMWDVWSGSALSGPTGLYGNTLFGGATIHHIWHTFAQTHAP